ncbi:hypothetical protein [Pseudomonas sp. LP_7_YM]|uniref:hypothetical protein n=1 Tax=Pseudomonas sp. LP_7_YM TaxID=2485137 RepID=UPI00105F7E6B|nr:hypothetical protein [Pseudomonas sp. LP_7_YM]TDV67792.1 hypothetical protein EC915_103329 [Pseudomonas sp. LP_7_YM]
MATQDNQQTTDRNDPAIDPDTPDNHMGQDKPATSRPGEQNSAQGQENKGSQSGENTYTPNFEPEEHESLDTTGEEKDTGETDADIDTQGG